MTTARGTYLPHAAEIDVSGWFTHIPDLFAEEVTIQLRYLLLEWEPPSIALPIMWSEGDDASDGSHGPAVTDPLTLHLALPFGPDEATIWSFSLRGIIDDFIDAVGDEETMTIEESEGRLNAMKIVNALRAEADRLERAIVPQSESRNQGSDSPPDSAP